MGQILRAEMRELSSSVVNLVRGKGLLNAIVIQPGNLATRYSLNRIKIF